MSNYQTGLQKIEYRWNLLSIRQRRNVKKMLLVLFFVMIVLIVLDFFHDVSGNNRQPEVQSVQSSRPDHFWSDLLLGVTGLGGTFVSIFVFLKVSSKEANTLGEYLDIFNEILDGVKSGEEFYILSPAHNAGQKDATLDDESIKRKYELNQQLLTDKVKIAKGEYTLLEFYNSELSLFKHEAYTERMRIIERYLEQYNKDGVALEASKEYSLLFKFLMKFSKDAKNKTMKQDDVLTTVQKYMLTAYSSIYDLVLSGLRVNGIEKDSYLQAPMVLIISKSMAYFGQYKLTEVNKKSTIIIRGVKIMDEHGINSLKILYDAVTEKFAKVLEPVVEVTSVDDGNASKQIQSSGKK
jgi:hypothetical protein